MSLIYDEHHKEVTDEEKLLKRDEERLYEIVKTFSFTFEDDELITLLFRIASRRMTINQMIADYERLSEK